MNQRTIHMVHGIHTSTTSRRMANLQLPVGLASGMRVRYHEYGDIWGIQTRRLNPGIAQRIAKEIAPGDVIAGFSNGGCIGYRAIHDYRAPAVGLVLLNAALKDNIAFPPSLRFIHVYYNNDDSAVPWAERSFKILTDPLWGDMGRDGYTGADPRVSKWDCEATASLPCARGHSSLMTPPDAEAWATFWGGNIGSACANDDTTWPPISQAA